MGLHVTIILILAQYLQYSWDSSFNKVKGYRLNSQQNRVQLPAGAKYFSLLHRFQTCVWIYQDSIKMGTGGSFPSSKVTGV
jgi:hypothetical protein